LKQSKPHFFCENCGTEVPLQAKKCPGCGRDFQAVRCPNCNFTGEEALFKSGCPVCGYTPGKTAPAAKPGKETTYHRTEALPLWVYIVSGLTALAVVFLVFWWLA
jgi:ssDNA-binding Zn-finger/Zn-ribbon topoisomerase 1